MGQTSCSTTNTDFAFCQHKTAFPKSAKSLHQLSANFSPVIAVGSFLQPTPQASHNQGASNGQRDKLSCVRWLGSALGGPSDSRHHGSPAGCASLYVKGGGKVGHVGGSIVGLRLSTFSEKVWTNWTQLVASARAGYGHNAAPH